MTATPRDFQKELNLKLLAIPFDEKAIFEGTTELNSLKKLFELVLIRMKSRTILDFRLELMIEVIALYQSGDIATDMLKFSALINEIPKMTANEIECHIEDFVIIQTDALRIIKNYNAIIAPAKTEIDNEAKKYAEKQLKAKK